VALSTITLSVALATNGYQYTPLSPNKPTGMEITTMKNFEKHFILESNWECENGL
jgi:hypothetical protein